MHDLPSDVMALAGFTLAHAAWSICDTAHDELLVPLAIVEAGGERQLLRFEASTQAEAIAKGKATLAAHEHHLDAWAFAREGTWRPSGADGTAQDVLTVEFRGGAMRATAHVLQPFARATAGEAFRLLGPPLVVIDGRMLAEPDAQAPRELLAAGIGAHAKAVELWPVWQRGDASEE